MVQEREEVKRTSVGPLPSCCIDFDIALTDLIFPERLSSEGREFVEAHGIASVPLAELIADALDMGDGKVKLYHRCNQLLSDGRCGIYETRPQICRAFDCALRHDCDHCDAGRFTAQTE